MYVFEYLSLQRELAKLKKQTEVWKPMREHLKIMDDISILSIKIRNLHLKSNN